MTGQVIAPNGGLNARPSRFCRFREPVAGLALSIVMMGCCGCATVIATHFCAESVRPAKPALGMRVRSGERRCRTLRDDREHSMTFFRKRQTALWSVPALLLLSSCGGTELECGSLDARNSVLKIVSDDSNNALVSYAAKNSSAVEARINSAPTEAEKSAVWEEARRGASYRLDETISTNSRSRRAVTCSGLLYATIEDATAQKQVDFKVEQTPDGRVSVSVSPFQFQPLAR
jgi:hypothetical protein